MFSEHKGIKLEIKSGGIAGEILKYIEINASHTWLKEKKIANNLNWIKIKNTACQNVWDAAKAVLRGNL